MKHVVLAPLMLCVLATSAATGAQEPEKARIESVAIAPWVFEQGTNGAVATAKDFLRTVLLKAGFEVRDAPSPERTTISAEAQADRENRGKDSKSEPMATPKQLLEIGERMGVTYVITGRANWHSRAKWIGLGPKTKSDCTVDILIVDVAKKEIAHEITGVKMDSNAKDNTLKALGALFVTHLFTTVSGGPKTPHEQRAAQLAIAKALDPWLAKRPVNRKIE